MTTSGVVNFSVTMNDLIYGAFQAAEVYAAGDVLDADDYNVGKHELNKMVKAWQAKGLGLWFNQEVTLPLAYEQQSYLLGPTGNNCSAAMGETSIATAAVAGAGTITVADASTIVNGQYLGIELDDGTMQWTTVNGIPAGNVVTLAAVLTAAAAIGNVVFFYTAKITRPLEVIEARLRTQDGEDTPLYAASLQEYRNLSVKSDSGKPTQVAYDPQMVNGVLYVWQPSSAVSDRIILTIKRPVQDFVSATDTPDFPVEWSEALEANLALRLSFKFSVPARKKQELAAWAKQTLDDVDSYDREKTSVFFVPAPYRG